MIQRDVAGLAHIAEQITPANGSTSHTAALFEPRQHSPLQVLAQSPLAGTGALGQETHVDKTSAGICRGLLDRGADQAHGFFDVGSGDFGGEAHARVRFGKANH